MPNIVSAKKRVRQSEKRRLKNLSRRTAIKTAVKKIMTEISKDKVDVDATNNLLRDIAAKLARAKSKGVMHRNTASRKLSRLTKKVNLAVQEKTS